MTKEPKGDKASAGLGSTEALVPRGRWVAQVGARGGREAVGLGRAAENAKEECEVRRELLGVCVRRKEGKSESLNMGSSHSRD